MAEESADAVAPLSDRLGRMPVGPGLTARSLEIFTLVARHGSMSAAARHLGLSQPAISQAVSALESALGIQLFDRSVRPPVLTLQAAALLAPVHAVLDSLEQFERALRRGNEAELPTLRIGMINSFAATMGPFLLERIRTLAAELTINSGFQATRIRAVVDRSFDVAITSDESPTPPGIDVLPMLTEPLLIVVPAAYRGDAQALAELSRALDLIRFGRDLFKIARFDQTLAAWGVKPGSRYHLDTHEAVLQMVATGAGWAILPPLAVYHALERGEALRIAPFPEASMQRTLKLVCRHGEAAHLARQIHDAAIEALQAVFLPRLAALMPGIADRVVLHAAPDPLARLSA